MVTVGKQVKTSNKQTKLTKVREEKVQCETLTKFRVIELFSFCWKKGISKTAVLFGYLWARNVIAAFIELLSLQSKHSNSNNPLSISPGSIPLDSTNLRWKIFTKENSVYTDHV